MKPQTEKLRSVICNRTNDACVTNEYFSFKVIVCVICTLSYMKYKRCADPVTWKGCQPSNGL